MVATLGVPVVVFELLTDRLLDVWQLLKLGRTSYTTTVGLGAVFLVAVGVDSRVALYAMHVVVCCLAEEVVDARA